MLRAIAPVNCRTPEAPWPTVSLLHTAATLMVTVCPLAMVTLSPAVGTPAGAPGSCGIPVTRSCRNLISRWVGGSYASKCRAHVFCNSLNLPIIGGGGQ